MTYKKNGVTFAGRNKTSKPPHMRSIEERFPIHEHNENSKLCTGATYSELHPEETVSFDRIADTTIDGFPIYISRDNNGTLQATFNKNTHALIIGSTGSGKTTGFVLPFLNWMCAKKDKPIIVISDPKDELSKLLY